MMERESQEARLVRLEENDWFQERKLAELEEYAKELRLQLRSLEKQCESLRHGLERIEDALCCARQPGHAQAEPLPPHWQEKPEKIIIQKKGEVQ